MSLWLFLALEGVLLLAALLILLWHPQRSQKGTGISTYRKRSNVIYRDDDSYWYGGMFYNNPDDPALFVPKRFGLGWTLNFGNSQARWFLIGIFLLATALPIAMIVLGVLFPGSFHPTGCHPSSCYP